MRSYKNIIAILCLVILSACSMNKARNSDGDDSAFLTVNAIPWGEVYIEGQYIDSTPVVKHALKAGLYLLEIRRNGFDTHREGISVKRSRTAVYSIKLVKP
ncbi:MAG TPA: PEGA domain-containing protein [Gammaproteobacteria bacterium]|nr:PEGA domain-containing protein [Gammaproteobacteria bacterium]